jgi:hypothetical protein
MYLRLGIAGWFRDGSQKRGDFARSHLSFSPKRIFAQRQVLDYVMLRTWTFLYE